jgi:hypothetical protein
MCYCIWHFDVTNSVCCWELKLGKVQLFRHLVPEFFSHRKCIITGRFRKKISSNNGCSIFVIFVIYLKHVIELQTVDVCDTYSWLHVCHLCLQLYLCFISGLINEDKLRELLMTMGDRFTDDDVSSNLYITWMFPLSLGQKTPGDHFCHFEAQFCMKNVSQWCVEHRNRSPVEDHAWFVPDLVKVK